MKTPAPFCGWDGEGARLDVVLAMLPGWITGLPTRSARVAAGIAAGGDAERRSALQDVDGVELPAADGVIDPPGNISAESFSAAKGQFIDYAGAENVIHVLVGQAVLDFIVGVELRS